MITKAATRNNIHHGFIANSLGDEKYKYYPDFNKILAICKRNPKTNDSNRSIESFTYYLIAVLNIDMYQTLNLNHYNFIKILIFKVIVSE